MHLAVVEVLNKKGPLAEPDLLKELKQMYGDVSPRELNKELMKLEIWGLIRVTKLMKGKRMVELAEKEAAQPRT